MTKSIRKSIMASLLVVFVIIMAMFLMACDDKKSEDNTVVVPKNEVVKISTLSEFMAISNDENKAYELTNDIDCEGAVLTPIGCESQPFIGTLDGKGFEITNFVLDESSIKTNAITGEYYAGVFGVIGDSQIKDITFSNFGIDFMDNGTITNVLNFGLIAESQDNANVVLSNVSISNMNIAITVDNIVFGSFIAKDSATGSRSGLKLQNSTINIFTNGEFVSSPIVIGGLFGSINASVSIDACEIKENAFDLSYMGMGSMDVGLVGGALSSADAIVEVSNVVGENTSASVVSFGESTLAENIVGYVAPSAVLNETNNTFANCEMIF